MMNTGIDTTSSSTAKPLLLGFLAGVTLFALTACTLAIVLAPSLARSWNVASGPGQIWAPPPTATPTPAPSPTPTASAVVTPTVIAEPSRQPGAFEIGDTVVNAYQGNVNLRRSPGYINKPPSDRVALVPSGAKLEVLGGPQTADELVWWYVRWRDKEGWMAERRSSGGAILELAK